MNPTPRFLLCAVLSVATAALLGCSEDGSAPTANADSPPGFPREVRSGTGDTLHVVSPPRAVIPLNAGAFDLVRELIGPEQVAALPATITEYAHRRTEAAWESRPRFSQLEGEELLSFDPDCVVSHSWQQSPGLGVLKRLGVLVYEIPDVDEFAVVLDSLEGLGRLFGREERAATLIRSLRARQEAVHDSRRAGLRVMTYGNFGSGGWTAGEGTTADVVIRMTGMVNAAAEAGLQGHCRMEIERFLEVDPDVLIVSAGGDWQPTLRTLRETSELRHLKALEEDHILEIPGALYGTTSHYLIDFAEYLARAVDEFE